MDPIIRLNMIIVFLAIILLVIDILIRRGKMKNSGENSVGHERKSRTNITNLRRIL